MDAEEGITSRPDVDEQWITEVEKKIDLAFKGSLQWPWQPKDETEPKICKFTLLQYRFRATMALGSDALESPFKEISRPRLVTAGEFSRPVAVSIGPLHMRQKKITISNKVKWMFVYFVNYMYDLKSEDLARCLRKMKNQVPNARSCYANLDLPKRFSVKDDRMAKVLDVVFDKDEIALDLLILSNQIPFFAIEELFTELKSEKPLHEYALQFFETIHPRSARHCMDENSPPKFLHLLDLFHWPKPLHHAFSAFMRNLLQTEEDVKLLRRSGILASSIRMDAEEGISIADNASRPGERVGAGIDEEVASPAIERSDLCDEYAGSTGIYAEASGPAFEPSVRHWIGELSDAASYEAAASSPAVEPSVRSWVGLSAFGPSAEGWIGEVQEKMRSALAASPSLSSISHFRRSPEICKFVLDEAFCRPRVVAIGRTIGTRARASPTQTSG
uniref:Uncharacterized protein n=1 Tax=Ananas comosus var. bracteatus TaxID=296719 RepID=A0A6V7P0M3_ANACO|nr:unnamed protein product [Ananas comosus var. bracteatus]